jgi:hypothetical protein
MADQFLNYRTHSGLHELEIPCHYPNCPLAKGFYPAQKFGSAFSKSLVKCEIETAGDRNRCELTRFWLGIKFDFDRFS